MRNLIKLRAYFHVVNGSSYYLPTFRNSPKAVCWSNDDNTLDAEVFISDCFCHNAKVIRWYGTEWFLFKQQGKNCWLGIVGDIIVKFKPGLIVGYLIFRKNTGKTIKDFASDLDLSDGDVRYMVTGE